MSKKTKKKSTQATRLQQQQQAAAKRRVPAATAGTATSRQLDAPPDASTETPSEVGQDRHYLDVSAVRIQEWLARTPDLKFRRGASVLLTEATARDEWEDSPPLGTRWNDEAGDVGGVVSLTVTDDTPQADVQVRLTAAALVVARKMRELMPHCQVQAVTGTGDSYAVAYRQMQQARRDSRLLVDSPPASPELILAKPCDQCRSAAAAHPQIEIIVGEPRKDLCTDCRNRFEAAGGTKGDELRRSPLPERRMKQALAEAGMIVKGFSDNFAKMAAAGERRADDASTQLALIYVDGNRVGGFLAAAAAAATRSGKLEKTEIARVIDDAIVGALADAVRERFEGRSRPPVLANLAGGDDLLVSVPAGDAWLFTCTLLRAFGSRVGAASSEWPKDVRAKVPTLSAGLVFHHVKDPFSDVIRLAEGQLRRAKEMGRGLRATVAFLDLTADGGDTPAGREPLTLEYLTDNAGKLAQIAKLPPSRIATLLALYRQEAHDDLVRRLTDLDNGPLWDVIAGTGATLDKVRETLEGQAGRENLRRLLDLARHWNTERTGSGA